MPYQTEHSLIQHDLEYNLERKQGMALWPIFLTVLFAELGDKTQLATLLFATDQRVSKAGVFFASSAALVLSTLLAVIIGGQLPNYISPRTLKLTAGIGFIAIGIWVLVDLRH
ncbi:MAG: TMEM165/GDT1 family protein [Nitrospirales bacterium]